MSIRYADRLPEAETVPTDDRVGDSHGNAFPETIDGLYKSEIIHSRGPWRNFEAVEYATLEWVAQSNHRRLLERVGKTSPAEAEAHYYAAIDDVDMAA